VQEHPPETAELRARRPSGGRRLADAALTVAAIGGVVCILLVIAASVFHITLIMFKTGSMSPTIPAGSLAVVREIPASEARVGDVVTIARPGELPITHRVTSVTPLSGDLVSITMKGDANDSEDPAPYAVNTVRMVLYAVPGLANAVIAVSHPLALGAITLAAALLVSWAFWPRGHGSAPPRAHGRRRQQRGARRKRGAGAGAAVLVVALAATPALLGEASPARAAEVETIAQGRYLTLVSIGNPDEMGSLSPERPVPWQVGVMVAPPEPGTVHIGISATGTLRDPGELDLEVLACAERWAAGVCASGESVWVARQDLAGAVARVPSSDDNPDGAREIGALPASNDVWLMLNVTMPAQAAPGTAANLRLHAWGVGDVLDVGDGAEANGGQFWSGPFSPCSPSPAASCSRRPGGCAEGRPMSSRRLSRLAAGIVGLSALTLVLVAPATVSQTDAAWIDREFARASLSTATIPKPVLAAPCTTNPGLLGASPSITVDWTLPAGYALASARYAVGSTVAGLQGTTTGYTTTTVTPGNYRTVFSGGLLSGLLGGTASVGISVVHSSGWTSTWASATGGSALLGIGPYCNVNP
jgi:signal peptidase